MPSLFSLTNLIYKLLSIPGIIFVFTLKGFSQAWTAKKLGDPTPEMSGKLTMSPRAHIDIIGFLCILLLGIGWGKPVPTNSRYYKRVKRDSAIQILSGPAGCILGGFAMSFFHILFNTIFANAISNNFICYAIVAIFESAENIAIVLAIFYLLPLPGLDGYNLIANFLPYKYYRTLYNIEKYSMFIFLGFILLLNYAPYFGYIIYWPASLLSLAFNSLWSLVLTPLRLIF